MKALCLALLLVSSQSYAMTFFLVKSWTHNGNTFCQYQNGTVINIGLSSLCALSING